MAAPVLQFKRGLIANLPGLRAGEPGFTTDSYDLYVGIDSTTNNNKFFGSHRYWTRETASVGSSVNLVEGTSNGSNYVALKAPDNIASNVTYTLPGTQGAVSSVLTNNGSGTLTWASGSANPVFTGIATFSDTTDNTLGNADTGAVQIDGGVGINKNLTVGQNLHVAGISTFVGAVTFEGGTITLGDAASDNVVFGADINSSILPNTDATFDVGTGSQRWRNTHFSGIGTFATGAVIDAIQIGITAASEIDTSSGNLTLDSAGGTVAIDDNATVSGTLEVTGNTTLSGTLDLGHASDTTIARSSAGTVTIEGVTVATETNTLTLTNKTINLSSNTLVATSAQLATALTDETGSGSAVFATSPTLVTPVLGAASATSIEVSGAVNVGTALSAPTVKTATIQHSNGTQAATIDTSGNITASQNLTITGNLFINGSTTQVNTASITVEDRTIELGVVDGSAPSSSTSWDLGVLFNYHDGSAKKSALVWEQGDARFKLGSVVADGGGTGSSNPQITFSNYAALEIGSLWVNDCAGQSQVINCSGITRTLENITIDGGSF